MINISNTKHANLIIVSKIYIYLVQLVLPLPKLSFVYILAIKEIFNYGTQDAILKGFDEFFPITDDKKFFES